MAVANVDKLEAISMTEKLGVVRSLTRKARVIFTQAEINSGARDFSITKAALDVLTNVYSIGPFSTLASFGFESLVLVERTTRVAEDDPGIVDVELKYEHILDGPNQQLIGGTPSGILFGKGKCSITEKTTNFFYPYGDVTFGRVQLEVAHTFTENEWSAIGSPVFDTKQWPLTVFQSGEISLPFPQANFQLLGYAATANPWSIANNFIAKINSKAWLNQPPNTWICSEVQWDVIEAGAFISAGGAETTYRFSFEFQYNSDTWNPTVIFHDSRTGHAPVSCEEATDVTIYTSALGDIDVVLNLARNSKNGNLQPAGVWNVPALAQVDFEALFGSIFE